MSHCEHRRQRLTLTWTKQRDDESPAPIEFEMVKVGSSLALKAVDQSGGKLDGNRLLCLQAVHRLNGDATHKAWMEEAGLKEKRSSFNKAVEWLVTQVYVKHEGKKYAATGAGRMALGPLVHRQSTASPSSAGSDWSTTLGSRETPVVDQDPNSSGGPRRDLTREEEEEYFAQQASLKLEAASS